MRMTATTSLGLLQLNTDILRLSDWCHNMYLNTYCRFRLMIAQKFISCWDYWTWTIKRSNCQLKMAHRTHGRKDKTNFSFIKCRCLPDLRLNFIPERERKWIKITCIFKSTILCLWSFYYARILIGKRILKCFEN